MSLLDDLFKNIDFKDLFSSRSKAVQEAILKYPPGRYKYRGDDGSLYASEYEIVGYEECDDGTCTTCRTLHRGGIRVAPS